MLNKFSIPLANNYRLIAEQNSGEFDKEIFVGIEDENGRYVQDLAVIRPTYSCSNENIRFDSDKFEILVFGDSGDEDYTDKFVVPLAEENDE